MNQHLFTQTNLDSGALTVHGAVIHPFAEFGRYEGRAIRRDRTEGTFHLLVDEEVRATQVHIDLALLNHPIEPCGCRSHESEGAHFEIHAAGYVVFFVSSGPGGFAVRVGRRDEEPEESFDSTRLGEGDLFAATMIRPGRYRLTNEPADATGDLVVGAGEVGSLRRPPDPVRVMCSVGSFRPKSVRVNAGQGQIYSVRTPSRIRIELEEGEDRPRPRKTPASARRR